MVNMHDRTAIVMHHRRQLVHPLAVVAIVVRVDLGKLPTVLLEDFLDAPEIRARDEHIDVGDAAAVTRWKPGGDVRAALQQNPRLTGVEEGAAQTIDLPSHRALVAAYERVGGDQTIAEPGGRVRRQGSSPHPPDQPPP